MVRWELRPRIFLRTTEFLWQEGHTAHSTEAEAWEFAIQVMNDVYKDFMEKVLLIPIFTGIKTESEKFPGAVQSFACEAIMKDGKALQMGTSHALGQSFSKIFNIKYLDKDGEHFVWQTSWGVSTRMVGGLIMTHGDDHGLNLPPDLAPIQVVIMVIKDEPEVRQAAEKIASDLKSAEIKVEVDDSDSVSFGKRSVDWELKGIPIRIEIGPRDIKDNQAIVVRRDLVGEDLAKQPVSLDDLKTHIQDSLLQITKNLWERALSFQTENITQVSSIDEAIEVAQKGFAKMAWDDLGKSGEAVLLEEGVSVRCLQTESGDLPKNPEESNLQAILARGY